MNGKSDKKCAKPFILKQARVCNPPISNFNLASPLIRLAPADPNVGWVCAIQNDNGLYCAGDNSGGQMLTGSAGGSALSLRLLLSNVAKATIGVKFGCAIYSDTGKTVCWGNNSYGQLGRSSSANAFSQP